MVLRALEHESLSGSEIMHKLEENIGWKPSCGSIYPVLASLEKNREISKEKQSAKKIYSLTKKGRTELKKHNKSREELAREILKIHKMIESTYGVDLKIDEKEMSESIQDNLKSGGVALKYFGKESTALKKEFMLAMLSGKAEKHSAEIKEILNEASKKLRNIRLGSRGG